MIDIGKYDHIELEQKWQKHMPKSENKNGRFSVVIPPPNVTGSLHMGHALNITLQDIICRWQLMNGKDVMWVPGFDHAGIATQYVVEKKLQSEGKNRLEIGKGEFLKAVWEWVPVSRESIKSQLLSLGAVVKWDMERFTMDEGLSRAVRRAFKILYKEGLIYRSNYMISWCPNDLTALSDLEVEHEEQPSELYYIRYNLEGEDGYIVVATTRPETLLGDVAVAVHPQDERYKNLVGKTLKLPLVSWERLSESGKPVSYKIPLIADERIKPEFGTGAVKITPAHDALDFEIALSHGLEKVNVMDEHAVMNQNAGPFKGLERYEARKRIISELKTLGLLEKIEPHKSAIGRCYRCKTVIEPRVSSQWFLKVTDPRIKEKAIQMVTSGRIKFIPQGWSKLYLQWMENLRDWCISRQIWWGHKIPVWHCNSCGHINVFDDEDFDRVYDKIIFNLIADGKISQDFTPEEVEKILKSPSFTAPELTVLEFYKKFAFYKYHSLDMDANSLRLFISQDLNPTAILTEKKNRYRYNPKTKTYRFILRCQHCNSEDLIQEEDVLDTWFSSALWPFSVFGWPEDTKALKDFYPTDLLVTGFDIIFFWVARMIMMGSYFTNEAPFRDVYIHALIRDEKGQKMSKTKGNVIDPLEVIKDYGADALRFTLAILTQQGRDLKLSTKSFEGYRHFINKLWNAGRFIMMNVDKDLLSKAIYSSAPGKEDLWISSKLNKTAEIVNKSLENYEFSQAARALYEFVWSDFCDWYIELVKVRLKSFTQDNQPTPENISAQLSLLSIFEKTLRLLHPFIPFVTSELWQYLPSSYQDITKAGYYHKDPSGIFPEAEREIEELIGLISSIRALRADLKIPPSSKVNLFYLKNSLSHLFGEFEAQIKTLAKIESIELSQARPPSSGAGYFKDQEFFIPLPENSSPEELISGYERRLLELSKTIESLNQKLSNQEFLSKAPEEEVEKAKNILEDSKNEALRLQRLIKSIR
ncbi:MAG: valine--tRNA ligase [Aquificaceae bacterium]